jgi:LPS-assembly lipoprotein
MVTGMRHRLLAIILLLTLGGCGWQLRDAQVVPQTIGSLHVATQLSDRDIVNELTRALDVYGVKVVDSAAAADYSVVIVDFRQNRRIATLNASARVAEYQLNDDLDFLIADATGAPLTALLTASVERSYEIEERDILSSENEERQVRREMREEIVRQILNRLKVLPDQAAAAKAAQTDKQ